MGTCATEAHVVTDSQNLWISNAIEDMIIHNQTAYNIVTGELFRNRLMDLAIMLADGKKTKLAVMLRLSESTMNTWITKKQKPLFPQLLYLCNQLGLMPSELLLGVFDAEKVRFKSDNKISKFHVILPKKGLKEPPKADIYLRLKAICNDASDCRPLTQVVAELSSTKKYLIYWFETECALITLKYRQNIHKLSTQAHLMQVQSVRNITWSLHEKGIYPSYSKVTQIIAPLKLNLVRKHIKESYQTALKNLKC